MCFHCSIHWVHAIPSPFCLFTYRPFSSFTHRGDMTRHGTIWWGKIQLIPREAGMEKSTVGDKTPCIYLTLPECVADGSVIQGSLTGNTRFTAAKQMPLPLWDSAMMNCSLIFYNFIFPRLPAGTALTVKMGQKQWIGQKGERIATKWKGKKLHRAIESHVSNKIQDSKDRCFGNLAILCCSFIHVMCDVFTLLTVSM